MLPQRKVQWISPIGYSTTVYLRTHKTTTTRLHCIWHLNMDTLISYESCYGEGQMLAHRIGVTGHPCIWCAMLTQVSYRTTLRRAQANVTLQCFEHGADSDRKEDRSSKVAEIVPLLISYGADVTALDMTLSTPLHLASISVIPDILQILIERGSDVNAQNETHSTPLHRASHLRCAESVQVLINHGADVTAQDWCHRTPLHLALSSICVSAKTCHSGSNSGLMSKHDSLVTATM